MSKGKADFRGTRAVLLAAATLALSAAAATAQGGAGKGETELTNPKLPVAQRVDSLVKHMTLQEKVSQMMNSAPAIPRLGIPAYDWWSEGLHGVARSGYATMFPQAITMAATWDAALIGQEANVISTEGRAKYNHALAEGNHGRYFGLTFWAPNINIVRDPRWGRGQETYGEDPYLTGTLATAYVKGMQDRSGNAKYYKVIATPKHFAMYSGPEPLRHKFNVNPSAYDLEATYFPAFRKTVVNGHADSVMCSYNAVDGTPSCANTMLLQKTLRKDWGFSGYVTSDCGAVHDFFDGHNTSPDAEHAAATAVLAGTDTNCGDTYKALVQAVHDRLLPESAIDTAVKRLFTARVQLGMFDPNSDVKYDSIPYSEHDTAAHRALAETAAREAMVLLKNDGTLPLKNGSKTIAVVGPNAASLVALEGNYNAISKHPVLPVDGVKAEFASAHVIYAQGSPYVNGVELPAPRTLFHTKGDKQGLTGEYYDNADLSGSSTVARVDPQVDFDWTDASPVPGLKKNNFSVRWTGTITVPKPGKYQFGLQVSKCSQCADREGLAVTFDGKPMNLSKHTPGADLYDTEMPELDLNVQDTKPHTITIEYKHTSRNTSAGISLRWMPPIATEQQEAVAAARKADVVLAFVGLTSELEGEEMPVHVKGFDGGDRTLIDLPEVQQNLLHALSATGKPLVVVLMNGSALAVNWTQQHANAIFEAWYPGEAGGTAIAQTLAGKNDPGGKLPLTFYTGVDQLPPFTDYSMKNRTYRYFTGKPLYPFGYGLSYTSFSFSGMKLSTQTVQAGQPLTVNAQVKNTGQTAGDEVAELYLKPPKTDVSPKIELVAFQRVHLSPGEQKQVEFKLNPRQMSVVNADGARSMSAGDYTLYLGGGQPQEAAAAPAKESADVHTGFTISGHKELPR